MSLQHGLSGDYLKRLRPISSTAKPSDRLNWVPIPVRDRILSGKLPPGVSPFFPGQNPGAVSYAWNDPTGPYTIIEACQEYPDDVDFYLNITSGDAYQARLLHQVYSAYNKDMSYFVETRRLSPEMARDEIRKLTTRYSNSSLKPRRIY
jgi:hypothetical protein